MYLEGAIKELKLLKGLSKEEQLTGIGRNLAELPLPPYLGKILLTSVEPEY